MRNHIAGAPLVWALLTTAHEWEHHVAVWGGALLLCGAGVALRAWSACHCHYAGRRPMGLAVTGPYGLVRNPLYLGNMLIIVGATIASEVLWLAPFAALWSFLVYAAAVRFYEEPMMRSRYGAAWRRYAEGAPAWIPVLRSPGPGAVSFLSALPAQAMRLLWLVPFVLKELHMFGLGYR
jgi:protein-S-isoprenylcysteine O-methyltransferase Ste14